MQNSTRKRSAGSTLRIGVAVGLALLVVAAAVLVASAAFATGSHDGAPRFKPRPQHISQARVGSHFEVLAHPTRARASAAQSVPAGAALAVVDGQREIYAWQPAPAQEFQAATRIGSGAKICLVERESDSGLVSVSCGSAATVEQEGDVTTYLKSESDPTNGLTALLPDGIASVLATDKGGATRRVAVVHNALEIEDANLASIKYTLPGGESRTVTMPATQSTSTQPGQCTPVSSCETTSTVEG